MAASGFLDRRDPAADVAEGWDPVKDEAGTRTGWKANKFSYPPDRLAGRWGARHGWRAGDLRPGCTSGSGTTPVPSASSGITPPPEWIAVMLSNSSVGGMEAIDAMHDAIQAAFPEVGDSGF